MKWELDLWYEMWDRAGSQGLDTWYELPHGKRRGGGRDLIRLPTSMVWMSRRPRPSPPMVAGSEGERAGAGR